MRFYSILLAGLISVPAFAKPVNLRCFTKGESTVDMHYMGKKKGGSFRGSIKLPKTGDQVPGPFEVKIADQVVGTLAVKADDDKYVGKFDVKKTPDTFPAIEKGTTGEIAGVKCTFEGK